MEIENYEPRHFDWAAKNLQVLISQCNGKEDQGWKDVFEVALKGLKVARATTFSQDFFKFEYLKDIEVIQNQADDLINEMEENEENDIPVYTIEISSWQQALIISLSMSIFKALVIEYNPEEFGAQIKGVIAAISKLVEEEKEKLPGDYMDEMIAEKESCTGATEEGD